MVNYRYTVLVDDSHFAKKEESRGSKIVYLIVALVLAFIFFIWQALRMHNTAFFYVLPFDTSQNSSSKNTDNRTRLIYGATKWFGRDMSTAFDLNACPELNCRLTSDADLANQSDALVFHIRDLDMKKLPSLHREPWQRYVFMLHESPPHTYNNLGLLPANYFNWTMTYRRDGDIFAPYGYISSAGQLILGINPAQVLNLSTVPLETVVKRKRKLGVWMASNCATQSKRELIIKVLQSHLDIDVWGACGNKTACPRNRMPECLQMVDSDYKFHFAFENSMCRDYITEKFWSRYLLNSVQVVLKRSILEPFVPKDSFIAVDDFDNLLDLVNYLRRLDSDSEEYIKYLASVRSNLSSFVQPTKVYTGFCALCQKVLNSSEPVKIYSKIKSWWYHKTCESHSMRRLYNQYNRTYTGTAFNRIKNVNTGTNP